MKQDVDLIVSEWICIENILGECLLISSLPGKASRNPNEGPLDSTCLLEAESGKLDINRRGPGILYRPQKVGDMGTQTSLEIRFLICRINNFVFSKSIMLASFPA